MHQKVQLKPSPTSMPINLCGVAVCILAVVLLKKYAHDLNVYYQMLILMLSYGLPVMCLEWIFLKPYRHASSGLNIDQKSLNFRRSVLKLFGLYSTLLLMALIYWVFPEYERRFFNSYFAMLSWLFPYYLFLTIPYFIWVDSKMTQPKDHYYNAALFFKGNWSTVNWDDLKQYFLGWGVKLFFLPLMFGFTFGKVNYFRNANLEIILGSPKGIYDFSLAVLYGIDVAVAVIGYLMTLRIFDSHIRSTESTCFGWLMALLCYPPFWSFTSSSYLNYNDGKYFSYWFKDLPWAFNIWAVIIILLIMGYTWATISFGLRFSNLTNRGIITNGPYRFLKHPAYVFKNISWWMISLPFLSLVGPSEAIRMCLILITLNFIYFFRARTEERHLSLDPDYIDYATKMNQIGRLAWLGRKFPLLQFTPGKLFNTKD